MSLKTTIGYLVYSIILFGLFIFLGNVIVSIQETLLVNGGVMPSYISFMYLTFGMLLGSPLFIQQLKKKGVWKLNNEKLLFVGLPALYLCFYPTLYFFGPSFLTIGERYMSVLFLSIESAIISGIIFGFVLITSISKITKQDDTKAMNSIAK